MTRVADVMTPGVETTTSSEALRDAARTMRKGDFGAMPVVDDGRLVGMLTDRDMSCGLWPRASTRCPRGWATSHPRARLR